MSSSPSASAANEDFAAQVDDATRGATGRTVSHLEGGRQSPDSPSSPHMPGHNAHPDSPGSNVHPDKPGSSVHPDMPSSNVHPDMPGSNVRLEEHIRLAQLQQIMREFLHHKPKDSMSGQMEGRSRKQVAGSMNLKEFKLTIAKVIDTEEYSEYLDKLFIKLDTTSDGFVDWNEFCTHLLLVYRENDYLDTRSDRPFIEGPKIRHITHNKQVSTTKTVAVQGPIRYLTISKEGSMSVWQPNLALDRHYTIGDQVDDKRRRFQMWVTDAVYMSNCEKVAVSSSSRDIRFFDVSSSQYFEEYHLFAMADVPYCLDYHYNTKQPNTESLLICGVDTGAIHLLTFLRPVTQLFQSPFKNDGGVQKIFMQDISSHSNWVRHRFITNIHPDIIRQVRYLPENEAVISASGSSKSTVIICDLLGVKKSYVFRIEKGVECFDHNKNLNLLVTGSADHIVRLWNPYVTSSPTATLQGHATGVIGVVIHEDFRLVFSYSRDAVVKVWDTREHACLQTVVLKFPSSLHGRLPEHGPFPLHLQGAPYDALVVTCNDYIASLTLGKRQEVAAHLEVTHETQLCSAIYNKLLKQVVTACDSSTISVWELATGHRSTLLARAHGREEVTCLAFDASNRRLVSGARDGTVKVWNFHNGHNLHKLEAVMEAEVTAIIHLLDKKCFVTVGWSQMIVSYDVSDAENKHLAANTCWKGGQLHKDDILTADFAAPNLMATASYDGEILVWDVDSERLYVRLRSGQPPDITKKLDSLTSRVQEPARAHSRQSTANTRPNSRHRTSHKIQGQIAPVDKLLFLKVRATVRFTECAVLISSEGGLLRWWSIYSAHKEMGHFYAPTEPDESVLAMCTAPDDSVLITGDTQGWIKCWAVQDYCLSFNGHVDHTTPPVEASWRAHDSAIVSVEHVEHECGRFILTASTDKTARLWTVQGQHVGTFGQKSPWDLRAPSTWAHPRTPSFREEQRVVEPTDRPNKAPRANERSSDGLAPVGSEGRAGSVEAQAGGAAAPGLDGREKSYLSPIQTFLGAKVEHDLTRRQRDRKERRCQFGDQSRLVTAGLGHQCTPYHSLIAPEWREVELPTGLPLPQRMQGQGYTKPEDHLLDESDDLEPASRSERPSGNKKAGAVSFSLNQGQGRFVQTNH